MYGLINSALQDMVIEHFGAEKWKTIHTASGVPEDSFLTMRRYEDETTYKLVGAAAEVLDTPAEDCLEMFGQYWVSAIATEKFSELMDVTGNDTVGFLHNLNALHDRITSTFLDYIPPEFQVEDRDVEAGLYHIHYHSERHGLTPFVHGLLKGLATHFGDDLTVLGVTTNEKTDGTHSVFEITVR